MHFYALTTKDQKERLSTHTKTPFIIASERIKYLGINLHKEAKDKYSENYDVDGVDERTQRWHKQMERYSMFLNWKIQYCENDYTTQSDL